MGGSVLFSKLTSRWFVQIYWKGKKERFWELDGVPLVSKQMGERLLQKIRTDITRLGGNFDPSWYKSNTTMYLSTYSERWLRTVDVQETTIQEYAYSIGVVMRFDEFGPSKDIRTFRADELSECYKWLKENFAAKTAYNSMSALRNLLRHAWRNRVIGEVPPFPKLKKGLPAKIKYNTFAQQEEFLKAIPAMHRPIFMFGMLYGLRTEEVRALQKDCLSGGQVLIKRSWPANGELHETTKNGEEREIGLTDEGRSILASEKESRSEWVFTFDGEKPYTHRQLSHIWDSARKKTGIDINLYNGIRHSFGCQLADDGVPLDIIGDLLGHKDKNMVRRYAKRSPVTLTEFINNRRIIPAAQPAPVQDQPAVATRKSNVVQFQRVCDVSGAATSTP